MASLLGTGPRPLLVIVGAEANIRTRNAVLVPAAFVASMLTWYVPAAAGMPLIKPVPELRVRLAGNPFAW